LIERRQEAAAADGKLLWQVASHPQGRFFNSATPIVDGQTVIYTGQGKGTKAVKIEKQGEGFAAKELWSNADLGTGFNTPVLKDGMLFGFSDKGNLFCLNAKTGQAAWTDPTRRGGNFAAILDAGSSLLALPSNSELIALKPGDKQYEEMARSTTVPDLPTPRQAPTPASFPPTGRTSRWPPPSGLGRGR
jgi:hypothetical protein